MRFVWFSLGQKLSWALNDRGTLKDTPTSTKMRFCLVIYSLLNLWKLSWEFPGNSSILLLFQLLKVDFDILFEHNHHPPPKNETENHVAGIQFFAWTTIWYRSIFPWSCKTSFKNKFWWNQYYNTNYHLIQLLLWSNISSNCYIYMLRTSGKFRMHEVASSNLHVEVYSNCV